MIGTIWHGRAHFADFIRDKETSRGQGDINGDIKRPFGTEVIYVIDTKWARSCHARAIFPDCLCQLFVCNS